MSLSKELETRSGAKCELCGGTESLDVYICEKTGITISAV